MIASQAPCISKGIKSSAHLTNLGTLEFANFSKTHSSLGSRFSVKLMSRLGSEARSSEWPNPPRRGGLLTSSAGRVSNRK